LLAPIYWLFNSTRHAVNRPGALWNKIMPLDGRAPLPQVPGVGFEQPPVPCQLQGDKAVKIAAHAHIIEFGLLAMILAFFQPYVNLREKWKLRWAVALLAGSVLLPVCALFELRFGLFAGGLADVGGLMVIVALVAMWIGIVRYTGRLDVGAEIAS
jgi:hypothetical protein